MSANLSMWPWFKVFVLFSLIHFTSGWIHHLKLQNDERRHIALTSAFGILIDGTMAVNLTAFTFEPSNIQNKTHSFGFTLGKSRSSSVVSAMENSPECLWSDEGKTVQTIYLRFDLANMKVVITHAGKDLENLTISDLPHTSYLYKNRLAHGINPDVTVVQTDTDTKSTVATATVNSTEAAAGTNPEGENKGSTESEETTKGGISSGAGTGNGAVDDTKEAANKSGEKSRQKRDTDTKSKPADKEINKAVVQTGQTQMFKAPKLTTLDITSRVEGSMTVYQTNFLIHVKQEIEEGLYSLFFHNCAKDRPHARVNLSMTIVQDNNGNYLSSDEMALPAMYFMLSVVFFILTIAWFSVLRKATEGVYKIHYLMLVVVLFKSLSSLFHGVNLYMIQQSGIHVDAWAILWYIVYLMRGALMFVTILLIGAGWVFIKHVFTDREKKLFLIFIPLQILDNVAWVIMEESEEGNSSYDLWRKIFIGVDLLCCFTILFPVVWSIRHLQEASKTDGKAAMNLVKLKLFRHYYFLIVCYIYFTRIIKYFLAITLPFHYGWLSVLFTEVFLLVFFILIGYKFRPMSDNPYLQVPQDSDDEDIEMDEVVTKTGSTEHVVRVNVGRAEAKEQQETSMKQRESSHEYD